MRGAIVFTGKVFVERVKIKSYSKGRDVDAKYPYLAAKGIKPHGIRQMRNFLMVPVRDTKGEIHGLQFIMPDGKKRFKRGTALTGCYHAMGKPDGRILIAKGYATGAVLQEITGHAEACAFTAGNLKPVAEVLKRKYPEAALVVCADDDYAVECIRASQRQSKRHRQSMGS